MILMTIFMLLPDSYKSQVQLFVGDNVHVSEGAQLHVKGDLILNTDKISGGGEIVLSGDKKQTIVVKKSNTQLAKISIKNEKGAEVIGKGQLKTNKKIYLAKGSTFFGKYLGNILSQDKTVNTKIALVTKDKNGQKIEEEFVPEVLGYGFIINITEVVKKTTSSSTKGLVYASGNSLVAHNHDFINLPLINIYYTKESSDYYYTQTYEDEDFSKIFTPPKIT